jgi:hypothetical protein
MSGATSGDWKRSYATRIEAPARPVTATPRSAATAPVVDSTMIGDAYLPPIALSVDVRLYRRAIGAVARRGALRS